MIKKQMTIVVAVCLLFSAATHADENQTTNAKESSTVQVPPQRPVAITADQLAALEVLADNPKHAVSPDTRAAFTPEAAKTMQSLSSPAFFAGYGGTLLYILLAAAPL